MAQLIGAQDSGNRYIGGDDGAFHFVPNPETAAANGYDWNDVFWYGSDDSLPGSIGDPVADVLAQPQPQPQQESPPPQPSSPSPSPSEPDATGGATSFQFYGRSWSYGDINAFIAALNAHGVDYSTWGLNHPAAAAILEGPQLGAMQEPTPKSLGQALQAYIDAGASAAEAAAQTEALRASLVAQGVSSVTPDQLYADAVALALPAPVAPPPPPEPAPAPADSGDQERELESATPKYQYLINVPGNLFGLTLPDQQNGKPTVKSSWRALIKTLANDTTASVTNARAASARFLSKAS